MVGIGSNECSAARRWWWWWWLLYSQDGKKQRQDGGYNVAVIGALGRPRWMVIQGAFRVRVPLPRRVLRGDRDQNPERSLRSP